jgi:hypothetical protein
MCTVAECCHIAVSGWTTELQLELRPFAHFSEQFNNIVFGSRPVFDSPARKLPLYKPSKQFSHHSSFFVFGGVCERQPCIQHLQP